VGAGGGGQPVVGAEGGEVPFTALAVDCVEHHLFQGAENDPAFFGVEAAWIPLDTNISPYVSAALGVVTAANDGDGTALGSKFEVGAEFFRLHGARLFVGASAVVPFENLAFTDSASFGAFVRVGF
jgi:hypothetical protein